MLYFWPFGGDKQLVSTKLDVPPTNLYAISIPKFVFQTDFFLY